MNSTTYVLPGITPTDLADGLGGDAMPLGHSVDRCPAGLIGSSDQRDHRSSCALTRYRNGLANDRPNQSSRPSGVYPGQAPQDPGNARHTEPVLAAQCGSRQVHIAKVPIPDLTHLSVCQLGVPMSRAGSGRQVAAGQNDPRSTATAWMASAGRFVGFVCDGSAEPKMRRVAAERVVAGMKNPCAELDGAVGQFPGYAVGHLQSGGLTPRRHNGHVSESASERGPGRMNTTAACPVPALIGPQLGDVVPERYLVHVTPSEVLSHA